MIVNERNFYIIKQNNGNLWNFFYDKNMRIACETLIENQWSNHLITKEYSDNFHVTLLPNDNICVFYKDFIGNIMIKIYDEGKWSSEKIIQSFNKDIFETDFRGIAIKDKIHLVYSVLNKANNTVTIFHQKIRETLQLSHAKIVDIINSKQNLSFKLGVTEKDELIIMYERLISSYEIGYRIMNKENERWSNFYIIDRSKYSYVDYSFLSFNNSLHVVAIKKDDNIGSVVYYKGNLSIFNYDEIFRDKNLLSCCLYMIEGTPFSSWVNDNTIYYDFFINNNAIPPYEESLTSLEITKATYASNFLKAKNSLISPEIYLNNEYNYSPILNENLLNYIMENYKNFIDSTDIIKEKDNLINKLKQDNLSKSNKLNSIREEFKRFKDNRNLLNESINFLQESLVAKEEEIKELQEKIALLNSPLKRFFNNLK
ncbi:hypothetical protein GCM10008905_24450 [Clostridium malenominatum]|uniref:Uncharacterized protein n=1 Tax=Clostridium malenominatum TaxID=1539 RepID=A0ABN1J367_9CLOT